MTPVIETPCTACGAGAGIDCRTRYGRARDTPHHRRLVLARTWLAPLTDPLTGALFAASVGVRDGQTVVACPYCAGEHVHGPHDGHRVAHCGPVYVDGLSPRDSRGYVIVGTPGCRCAPEANARWYATLIRNGRDTSTAWAALDALMPHLPDPDTANAAWDALALEVGDCRRMRGAS